VLQTIKKKIPRGRRTQAERREDSERGLVEAAIAVTAERGVSAATFEAIGERGGYSRSLVTRHFGSKRGLIDAVIGYLREHRKALAAKQGIDAMPGLDALLADTDLYLRSLSEEHELKAYFMLLSSAVADASPLRSAFATVHENVGTRLRDHVRKGQAEGRIRSDLDAETAALMIGSLQLGLSMQLLVDPTLNLEPIRKLTLAMLRLSFETSDKAKSKLDVSRTIDAKVRT
jgi:AcrR family transcriptional regulator